MTGASRSNGRDWLGYNESAGRASGTLDMLSLYPLLYLVTALVLPVRPAGPLSYTKQIAPIFAASCNACHGGAAPQSKLILTTYAALMKGGRRGAEVVAGNPAKSLLVQYIEGTKQPRMPIGGALKPAEIAAIRRWISEGAKVDGDANATTSIAVPHIPLKVKLIPQCASLAWSKDSSVLADGTWLEVKLLDPATGAVRKSLAGQADMVRSLALSPDGSLLACGGGVPGGSGEIKLWNLQTGVLQKTLAGHTDCIYGLAWRPDGKQIATTSYDKTVKLWDPTKDQPTADLKEHSDAVYAASYTFNGKYLATGSADKSIRVWDPQTGKRLYTLAGHSDMITCLSAHPAAERLASGAADKTVRIWNLNADGADTAKTIGGLPDTVNDVKYSPDGSKLAAALANGTVIIWKSDDYGEIKRISGCPDSVLSIAFRPDSKAIAVGGFDGSVSVFGLDGKQLSALVVPPKQAADLKKP